MKRFILVVMAIFIFMVVCSTVAFSKQGSLTINTDPRDAKIKILNIGPKFKQGMKLGPGKYHVEISASDYETKKMWVDLNAGEDKKIGIQLTKNASETYISKPSRGDNWTDPLTGMEFIWVPGKCYEMGCGSLIGKCIEDEEPVHEVCLDGFWIGKYEVTQGQWATIMGNNPSRFSSCGADCPVEKVSWNDAKKFIQKLNKQSNGATYQLPSEAQWEYVARSGGKKKINSDNIDLMTWYEANSANKTHPVGKKKPNDLGVYDMTGNVWEWCEDVYSKTAYTEHARNNPVYTWKGLYRVIRGGSWYSYSQDCRFSNRYFNNPTSTSSIIGFRLVLFPGS